MSSDDYFKKGRLKIKKKVQLKYGPGPFTKVQKQNIRREVDKKMKLKLRARHKYYFRKIKFEKNRVRLLVDGYSLRGVSVVGSHLIRYFKPKDIRQAVLQYLKRKHQTKNLRG
jgi:hypothetical protein